MAFLRAVNVGGHVVKMERLRELFGDLGFNNVRTYIQSGNVFFETDQSDRASLTTAIEQHLLSSLGYEVATFLRTPAEIEAALKQNPFKNVPLTPHTRHYIVFISEPLSAGTKLPLISLKQGFELLSATSGEVFVLLSLINGRHSNAAAFIEKTFGVKATARFWHTTVKILEAAKSS